MKKIFAITVFAVISSLTLSAQKLIIGEKAPDLKVSEWLTTKPAYENKARLIEFFHSSSRQCTGRLPQLESTAKKYAGKLTVIVICKEAGTKVRGMLFPEYRSYHGAVDDSSKTFDAFGVQYVPFGVLVDSKGRVVWFGNSASLDNSTIEQAFR